MIGGIIGVGLTLYICFLNFSQIEGLFLIVCSFVALVLYIISFVAGLCLWKGLKLGKILSIIIQAIQVPQFTIFGFYYFFATGLQLSFGTGTYSTKLAFHIGNFWEFSYTSDSVEYFIGINLIPILVLILLRKYNQQKSLQS